MCPFVVYRYKISKPVVAIQRACPTISDRVRISIRHTIAPTQTIGEVVMDPLALCSCRQLVMLEINQLGGTTRELPGMLLKNRSTRSATTNLSTSREPPAMLYVPTFPMELSMRVLVAAVVRYRTQRGETVRPHPVTFGIGRLTRLLKGRRA